VRPVVLARYIFHIKEWQREGGGAGGVFYDCEIFYCSIKQNYLILLYRRERERTHTHFTALPNERSEGSKAERRAALRSATALRRVRKISLRRAQQPTVLMEHMSVTQANQWDSS
jgi:hypothetical protein